MLAIPRLLRTVRQEEHSQVGHAGPVSFSHKNELCSYISTHIQLVFINSLMYIFKEPNIQNMFAHLSHLI